MDQKFKQVETPRPPQIPAQRRREGRSRYRSPSPSPAPSTTKHRSPSPSPSPSTVLASRRCRSPPSRTVRVAAPKRSKSAERKRPSSPVKDSSADLQISSGKVLSGRLPQGLQPSTMRSLTVSLQSDGTSVRVTKKEKALSFKSSSTLHNQPVARKSENSKPAATGSFTTSVDLIDKMARSSTPPLYSRRMSLDGMLKPLQKTATDAARLPSVHDRVKMGLSSIDDNHIRVSTPKKLAPKKSSQPKTSSVLRGVSPSPAVRQSTPSRGTSPTPARGASPTPSTSSTDFRNGKKAATNIEDAHQLRLLYNRYSQWQFANARADAVLHTKKVIAESTLYNVWNDTLALRETVTLKKISLHRLRLELKLNSLLYGQMSFLNDWALLEEKDYTRSLSGAAEDFKASTLRLPVTRGARVDTESLKLVVCSAVDVMQTLGSSTCSLLSQVETMNSLASELGFVAFQESEMLDECEALLASTAAMQVEEYSLWSHLIQMRRAQQNNFEH